VKSSEEEGFFPFFANNALMTGLACITNIRNAGPTKVPIIAIETNKWFNMQCSGNKNCKKTRVCMIQKCWSKCHVKSPSRHERLLYILGCATRGLLEYQKAC
jgi:hypothetical protein